MKQKNSGRETARKMKRGFTLIELLTVIAIIAVLAAIIFPVFGAVRENARQSNTMSSLYSTYVATKLYYEDEGKYPTTLFGYAEIEDTTLNPKGRPFLDGDSFANVVPMRSITGTYRVKAGTSSVLHRGYLYRDQMKDATTFINSNNPVKDEKAVTVAYYPENTPFAGKRVDWRDSPIPMPGDKCRVYGDAELPANGLDYVGKPKYFYVMDSLDIGPKIDKDGQVVKDNGVIRYELHYTPDWTGNWGSTCDVDSGGVPFVEQLKYKNPPTDHTIITYVTQHAVVGNGKVIALLLTGTARKLDAKEAFKKLPLDY